MDFLNEDEIFKALGNSNRREIIKTLGEKGKMSFTDIMKNIGNIDSPKLSYHLKTLSGIIEQDDGHYYLTEIGNAAVKLMDKIDQSKTIQKRKKKFMWANITSTIFLIFFIISIGFIIKGDITENSLIWFLVIFNILAQINQQVIWYLYRKSYSLPSLREQFAAFLISKRFHQLSGRVNNKSES